MSSLILKAAVQSNPSKPVDTYNIPLNAFGRETLEFMMSIEKVSGNYGRANLFDRVTGFFGLYAPMSTTGLSLLAVTLIVVISAVQLLPNMRQIDEGMSQAITSVESDRRFDRCTVNEDKACSLGSFQVWLKASAINPILGYPDNRSKIFVITRSGSAVMTIADGKAFVEQTISDSEKRKLKLDFIRSALNVNPADIVVKD